MTSSWLLTQRKNIPAYQFDNFADVNNSLGGWEDAYIINSAMRECRQGFTNVPIGNPYGFSICKRDIDAQGKSIDDVKHPVDPSVWNGYNKYSADMYEPWKETATQEFDPWGYYDRVVPNEEYLHRNDYLARDTRFNGTGIRPIHTPFSGVQEPTKYNEYGFSGGWSGGPPLKWDVQRQSQPYPLYKDIQKYHGANQEQLDQMDIQYNNASTMGTW